MRWLMVCLALLAIPLEVRAQAAGDPGDMEEDARLRFELGQRAYERGQFIEAAQEFEEAYRLSQRPALLYNTYVAYRDAQERTRAADALRRYLSVAPPAPNTERLRGILRALEEEIARGGPAPAGSTPRSTGGGGPSLSPGPFILLGGGVAVGIGAAVVGGLAIARNGDLATACPNDVCPDTDEARGIQSDVSTLSLVTDVLWPVATAAAVGGVIWLAVELAGGGGGDTAMDLSCDPGGCVARVGGTF